MQVTSASSNAASLPDWERVADHLDQLASGPSIAQVQVATALSIPLSEHLPTPVAAVVIRQHLSEALLERRREVVEVPAVLGEVEDELAVARTEVLLTGTRDEVSAWFAARYALKTSRGLRNLKPCVGDIVTSGGWTGGEQREISSIGDNGRVYMK